MASTTFTDNQTVIYADWLNDANNAVYNGVFAASSISPSNLVCNGSVSGSGFTGLVNNTLSAPGAIGNATPNTGVFTTLSATSLTLTNKLPVAQGGTGLATLTANNVILGNGTSTPSFVAPGTTGNVLKSNGTTWTSAVFRGLGLGGETWSSVIGTYSVNTQYTNNYGYPIAMTAEWSNGTKSFTVNGVQNAGASGANGNTQTSMFIIIPTGATWTLNSSGGAISTWTQLS
jgi:hypothetical protein